MTKYESENLTVFEYSSVSLEQLRNESENHTTDFIDLLEQWQKGNNEVLSVNEKKERKAFFKIGNKEIIFQQYVGVLKIGNVTIEVLPKIDKSVKNVNVWQNVLLNMLQTVQNLDIRPTNNADINIEKSVVLQFYFNWFINEVNLLMHEGLIKKYVQKTENRTALKGRLQLQKHIQNNVIHAERFYVTYNDYNHNHIYNGLLKQCLEVIERIADESSVKASAASVLNWFPVCDKVKVSEAVFDRLVYHRKTERYRTAIKIAKIILLKYHPDLQGGKHDVIAIMFDMNKLWEQYVLSKLQEVYNNDYLFKGQEQKRFWCSIDKNGKEKSYKTVRPDIVANTKKDNKVAFVIDTKWKIIDEELDKNVSDGDLKQMFVYNKLWGCKESYLLYPYSCEGIESERGRFIGEGEEGNCSTIKINILKGDSLDDSVWGELMKKIIEKCNLAVY